MIRILDQETVNRMAAGEVVNCSTHATKEILENSIDAGASLIIVKVSGLHSLEIYDDGTGIESADFTLLCARFATSKIRTFEDIKAVRTNGFRGEALASISYVSSIEIITKTNVTAEYINVYRDSKLLESKVSNVPLLQHHGTIIKLMFDELQVRVKELICLIQTFKAINNDVQFLLYDTNHLVVSYHHFSDRQAFLEHISETPLQKLEFAENKLSFQFYYNLGTKKGLQFQVINNRSVKNNIMSKVIGSINLRSSILKVQNAFLFISLTEVVDVNCHPQKAFIQLQQQDKLIQKILDKMLENKSDDWIYESQNSQKAASPSLTQQQASNPAPIMMQRMIDSHSQIDYQIQSSQVVHRQNTSYLLDYFDILSLQFDKQQSISAMNSHFGIDFESQSCKVIQPQKLIGCSGDQAFVQKDLRILKIKKYKIIFEGLLLLLLRFLSGEIQPILNPFVMVSNRILSNDEPLLGFTEFTVVNPLLLLQEYSQRLSQDLQKLSFIIQCDSIQQFLSQVVSKFEQIADNIVIQFLLNQVDADSVSDSVIHQKSILKFFDRL